jgi:hypothetical protein
MKEKIVNRAHVEGYVYSHKLEKKIAGPNAKTPGIEFIRGTLNIATKEDLSNIVTVNFTYETKVRNNGNENDNYKILEKIINNDYKNVIDNGIEVAKKVRIDTAIGVNDFYDREDKLVSAQRLDGGFIHEVDNLASEDKRSTFECDVILGKAVRKEADEEKNLPEKLELRGYIFNFRKEILPVVFSVFNTNAMDYFENLELSEKNPTFTRVKGNMDCLQVKTTKIDEGAFGDTVTEYTNTRKNYTITWAEKEPKEWDTEETMLASEMIKLLQDREVKLAAVKKDHDEYKKGSTTTTTPTPTANAFNF